jgi:hypothetical protein
MDRKVKLENVVRAISEWAPNLVVREESSGNVIVSLNMKLVDHDYLAPFTTDEEWE